MWKKTNTANEQYATEYAYVAYDYDYDAGVNQALVSVFLNGITDVHVRRVTSWIRIFGDTEISVSSGKFPKEKWIRTS